MHIEIRDANHFALSNARCALIDAGVNNAHVAYDGETIHLDVWGKLRKSDLTTLIETLGWYGLHPYNVTN